MRKGRQSYEFNRMPRIVGSYTVAGPREGEGSFGPLYNLVLDDDHFGEKSYEAAEATMQCEAVKGAISSAGYEVTDIDAIIAGDLQNQITASSFSARQLDIPFLGVYGACSTFGEGLGLAGILFETGDFKKIAVATSSHFSSAERQYRFPLELGNQRTPTSQWTVTGAGCTVLADDGSNVALSGVTFGRVIDFGITDVNNMGAAMAPAAADTLMTHFKEFGVSPSDYDGIFTGDLGKYGSEVLRKLCIDGGYDLGDGYHDCGAMIYTEEQDTFQGGSGAGCNNLVFNAHLLKELHAGRLNNILLVPTGALLSRDSPLQGETIPAIAHAVVIKRIDYHEKTEILS